MMNVPPPYDLLDNLDALPREFIIGDHMGGFLLNGYNIYLDKLNQYAMVNNFLYNINVDEFYSSVIKDRYSNLNFVYSVESFNRYRKFQKFQNYNIHPEINYKNFICSFNGTEHVSRKLLLAVIQKFGWYNTEYCSKNITFTVSELDGHISNYTSNQAQLYRKFFISDNSLDFFQSVNRINATGYNRIDHAKNIQILETPLTQSFIHLVSETMATSYVPFVTEKFLYSVVTRGLFVAYAPPGWHAHLEHYYGFKPYSNIFDYRFDTIQNPVERLVELMCMLSKFSCLSRDDWQNLYEMEVDTIEYNYDWYHGGHYLKHMEQFFS
jgi:hypothetical protein